MKEVVKIITVLLGLTMLLGGGICVATDTVWIFNLGGRNFQGILFMLGMLAVSAAVTWTGWVLLKSVKEAKLEKSISKAAPPKTEDIDVH